jgi:hypothetical protein
MIRRALLTAAVAAGVAAPAAQAQTTLVVQAAANVAPDGTLLYECAAEDGTTPYTQLDDCSFGPYSSSGWKNLTVAFGTGIVDFGGAYDLCVSATSYPRERPPFSVTRCAPYRPFSGQVIIGS